jgi:hypothetical protein
MATKPVLVPRVWASAGVYATGPFIGSVSVSDPGAPIAAEGHRPGASYPTAAEHENSQQNRVTAFVANWLALGSSLGAADAHIVETAADGRATVHGLTVNDLVSETAVEIISASAFAPAVSITCTTGANAVDVVMGNSSATAFSTNINAGAGTGFSVDLNTSPSGARGFFAQLTGALAGAFGLDVSADATTAGGGIRSSHAGAGYAVEAISTGVLAALNVAASALSTSAAYIAGGNPRALYVLSGTTAGNDAVHATVNNTSGFGVRAYVSGAATSASRGFYTSVTGDAIGAEFVATGNHALKLTGDTTNPVFGPLLLSSSNVKPSGFTDGQVAHVSGGGGVNAFYAFSSTTDGGWRAGWDTIGGFAYGANYNVTTTDNNSADYTDLCVATLTNANAPRVAGTILRLTVSMRVRSLTGAAAVCDVELYDNTSSAIIETFAGSGTTSTSGWIIPGTSGWNTTIAFDYAYAVPSAGDREIILRFKPNTGVGVGAQGSLVVTGGYDP